MIKTKFGISIPNILLPSTNIDLKKWSVVACDQYSSEPEYWNQVEKIVGDSPSTLRLTYPEAYLESTNPEEYIKSINENIAKYIENGYFTEHKDCLFLLERSFEDGKSSRKGVIASLDLEHYDFSKNSKSKIRATEGTILDRIPPRVAIRKDAPIEIPHIMILINDKQKTVVESIYAKKDAFQKIYDYELMAESGALTGYKIEDKDILNDFLSSIENLQDDSNLLFAVGDGNHSLATAKTIWNEIKKDLTEEEQEEHPARYALVEINNIYDQGIEFEPIHRVLFDADLTNFIEDFKKYDGIVLTEEGDSKLYSEFATCIPEEQSFYVFNKDKTFKVSVTEPDANITAGTVQNFIDKFCKDYESKVDYIHGVDSTVALGTKENNIGIILPNISKNEFFSTVINDGSFPRKTFSMGEAHEKRFYLEAKKIK